MAKVIVCLVLMALIALVQSRAVDHHLDAFAQSERAFSIGLLKSLQIHYPNRTHIFSPHSVYRVLTLAHLASSGHTEQSLAHALHLNWAHTKRDVYDAYLADDQQRANRKFETTEFDSADRLFVSEAVGIEKPFEDKLGKIVEPLNFAEDPEGSRQHINEFVEQVTRKHIRDILLPGDITPATQLILANAAFFSGKWLSKFDASNTTAEPFHGTQRVSAVQMMKQHGRFNYGYSGELGASFVELPYNEKDKSVSLFVFLPSESSNIDALVESLGSDVFDEVERASSQAKVTVGLPKMSFSQRYQLADILSDLGLGDLFDGNVDFSAISRDAHFTLDEVVHVAKIKVDENGSKAAAATVGLSRAMVFDEEFICNRPFVFMVYDKTTKQVLFGGVYANAPESG